MKDLVSDLGGRTARTVYIAFTVCLLFFGVLGFLGRDSYAPTIVDSVFGLTKYVYAQQTKEVDSGYTKTYVFRENDIDSPFPQVLYFYATRHQNVLLALNGSSRPESQKIRIYVDGQLISNESGINNTLPLRLSEGITQRLGDVYQLTENVHSLTITPADSRVQGVMVVDALVLVRNRPPE